MTRLGHGIYFTALAVWVGGLLALSIIVAPTVFKTAPSRAVAGMIFGSTLRGFGFVEMGCAAALLVSSLVLYRFNPRDGGLEIFRLALVGLMVLLVFTYVVGVNPMVTAERARIQNFEALSEGAPERARFDRLHRWSVRLMGANLLTGLALLLFSAATVKSLK